MGRNRVMTSVTVDPELFEIVKAKNINLSELLDEAIRNKLKEKKLEFLKW